LGALDDERAATPYDFSVTEVSFVWAALKPFADGKPA
jgi:hypothetical protein